MIILLSMALGLTCFMLWHIHFSHALELKAYSLTRLEIPQVEQTLTKESAKQTLKKLYDTPHIYIEKDLPQGDMGRSMAFFRVVEIDTDLDLHDYIIAYAHELCHVKFQVNNETYTAYQTFVTLYESGNAELQYHAMVYADQIVSGNALSAIYDCGFYILEYLKGERL